eukprot:gene5535-9357_t
MSERTLGEYIVLSKDKLGAGSFAKVLRGYHKETKQQVAVKKISIQNLDPKLLNSIESEILTLKTVKHPNILHLMDVYRNKNNTFLVTELCQGGDLSTYLDDNFTLDIIDEKLLKRFIFEIASGLKVLHAYNFIHRDLKPQNILLTSSEIDATIKIADFGFARFLNNNQLAQTLCGSPLYMAPESVGQKGHDSKVDLWSLGVIWYEIIYGFPPFKTMNSWAECEKRVLLDEIKFPELSDFSKECIELIKQLLERDPKKRLSAEQLLDDPYFDNFKKIEKKEEKTEVDLLTTQYLIQGYEIIEVDDVPEELEPETSTCMIS